jgi:tetratricopeptide (TPR) repeat protein
MKLSRFFGICLTLAVAGSASSFVSSGHARSPEPPPSLTGEIGRAFQESYTAESQQKFDAALAALDRVPPERRNSYAVLLRRGWLSYLGGHHVEAISAYSQAISVEPNSVEPRLGLMLPQMALQRWVDVEQTASEVLSRDPGSYFGLMRQGLAQYSLGKYSAAEGSYQKVVALHPADVEARSGLGWALLKQKKKPAALAHFTAILELSPTHAAAKQGAVLARQR